MGLRDKITPTSTTPSIRTNMSCAVLPSSPVLLFFLRPMANLSHLVAASFSSLALHSFSVSTANTSCLLATTFSRVSFLSNSLSSPHFNLFRVDMGAVSRGFLFSYLILSLSFFCSSVLRSSVCFKFLISK